MGDVLSNGCLGLRLVLFGISVIFIILTGIVLLPILLMIFLMLPFLFL